ncbi:Hypothetical protein A7982_08147 [Minicystis rosea]|nr:Hypothetical protein A7982_08147 [Minicystis rosea]
MICSARSRRALRANAISRSVPRTARAPFTDGARAKTDAMRSYRSGFAAHWTDDHERTARLSASLPMEQPHRRMQRIDFGELLTSAGANDAFLTELDAGDSPLRSKHVDVGFNHLATAGV